jgi:hypothetical protein
MSLEGSGHFEDHILFVYLCKVYWTTLVSSSDIISLDDSINK